MRNSADEKRLALRWGLIGSVGIASMIALAGTAYRALGIAVGTLLVGGWFLDIWLYDRRNRRRQNRGSASAGTEGEPPEHDS